jgi:hypothetical protein
MTLTMMDRIKARVLGSKQLLAAIALCTAGNTVQEDSVVTVRNVTVAAFVGTAAYKGAKAMQGSVNAQQNAATNNGGMTAP